MTKNKSQINSALTGEGMPFRGIPEPIKTYTIMFGDNIKVIEDKKSKTRVANFPFEFPDGTRGIIIVCRVKDESWVPNKTISSITINFK
jgi:cobalamin biosynthesis protein CbiD